MHKFCCYVLLLLSFLYFPLALSWSQNTQFNQAENYEGSSDLVKLEYHMGPVLASPINLYIIWYGHWNPTHQATIRDFLYSLSSSAPYPSVADWWKTVRLYTDQTGSNITGSISLSGEFYDSRAACGFHYFTFPTIVGVTVPYAWIGYSGAQCPGMCAYPFAWPKYSGKPPPSTNGGNNIMRAPNGDAGVDGMISVIAHELAEVSSNPLVNAWYAGDDPTAPTEIADLCLGLYGSGGGGGYVGKVYKDSWGNGYNLNGVKGRRFLVQWVWNPVRRRCFGPNAMD
ncbi:protein EXORDIUM-like 7 isoform X2 [Durio zibethinus]|uniref:Protein EXORDIUM-like 7 isoform X2 n=1 Tax=Durio zibethinus TaxID=66656 RepID=A0A6P5WI65_DURZI|nr:protein EXORDIUM-like 7 isoform X2 [Durio zibethinus]